ncbi:DUF1028 domain-containing protein [Pseudomonas putida]
MTFSIAGRCERTGMVGVAVTTSSICVGARCPWASAGVGAVSTQNVTLPSLGPMILQRLEAGDTASQALDSVLARQDHSAYRQVTVIDLKGGTAHFSGANTLGTHAVAQGVDCVAAGNLLQRSNLPQTMVETFEQHAHLHLAERLLLALEAGLYQAGGEQGPVHSAALTVADEHPWPLVDLRVDWNDDDPLLELRQLWQRYEGEMQAYVTRAINPASAPSYGVPGDE